MVTFEPITAIAEAINGLTKAFNSFLDKLPTLKNFKRLNKLEKASNIAEEIIFIADNYKNKFSKEDLKEYNHLRKEFFQDN